MKNFILLCCISLFICNDISIYGQGSLDNFENLQDSYMERSSIYDHKELNLNNIDTISGFDSNVNKLKLSGTIYKSDGVTPAKDVVLYIEQADENGDFDLRMLYNKRYIHNRGWIKTDSDGQYTFYTYVPGNDRRYNQLKQIFPIIKEPTKSEYNIASFLFDEDPLLSKLCRKRMTKKGDPSRVLKLKKVDGIFVAQKDIILYNDIY